MTSHIRRQKTLHRLSNGNLKSNTPEWLLWAFDTICKHSRLLDANAGTVFRWRHGVEVCCMFDVSEILNVSISMVKWLFQGIEQTGLEVLLVFGMYSVRILAGTPVILIVSRGFPQSLWTNSGIANWLGKNHFLPNPFQFIIHLYHPTIRRYIVKLLTASWSNQREGLPQGLV
jgi:hypothetical protein